MGVGKVFPSQTWNISAGVSAVKIGQKGLLDLETGVFFLFFFCLFRPHKFTIHGRGGLAERKRKLLLLPLHKQGLSAFFLPPVPLRVKFFPLHSY